MQTKIDEIFRSISTGTEETLVENKIEDILTKLEQYKCQLNEKDALIAQLRRYQAVSLKTEIPSGRGSVIQTEYSSRKSEAQYEELSKTHERTLLELNAYKSTVEVIENEKRDLAQKLKAAEAEEAKLKSEITSLISEISSKDQEYFHFSYLALMQIYSEFNDYRSNQHQQETKIKQS